MKRVLGSRKQSRPRQRTADKDKDASGPSLGLQIAEVGPDLKYFRSQSRYYLYT